MVSGECGHGHRSPWVENLAGLPLTARITWGSREGFRRETLGWVSALKDEKKAGKGKNHPEVRSPGCQGMVTRGRGENRLDAGVVGLRAGSWCVCLASLAPPDPPCNLLHLQAVPGG